MVNSHKIAPRGLNELKTINQHAVMASFDFYSKIIGSILSKRSLHTQTYKQNKLLYAVYFHPELFAYS